MPCCSGDADPDVPIFIAAKAEYTNLRQFP
jgi:hypothetical protein